MHEDLKAFQLQCDRMDWTYQMSDDMGVYQRGTQARAALQAALDRLIAAGLEKEARAIYDEARRWGIGGVEG